MTAQSAPAQEDVDLVAEAASILHSNGQSTSGTLEAIQSMNRILGTDFGAVMLWAGVMLTDNRGAVLRFRRSYPTGLQIGKVSALMRPLSCPSCTREDLVAGLETARRAAAYPAWLFALACAACATALAVIFGSSHWRAWLLVAVSAGLGGLLRRGIARWSLGSAALPAFAAALVAGLIGAFSVHAGVTSAARLVAVCPAMVLVPGPQVLNACLDLVQRRMALGVARLADAMLTILGISMGILTGLTLGAATLPVTAPSLPVTFGVDFLAAAVAAASYPIFFSMPYRYIPMAAAAGALGHGLRWVGMEYWGWSAPVGALACCLLVATVMVPFCHRVRMPFAGPGFAAVVALVPGVYLFRTASGILDMVHGGSTLIDMTLQDFSTAMMIVLAMTVGLTVPHYLWAIGRGSGRRRSPLLGVPER